jgi:hypothetical protein
MARTLVMIACCAGKDHNPIPMPAVNRYTSTLFQLSLTYAREVVGVDDRDIFILSAKHGVLRSTDLILDYNESLVGATRQQRKTWARRVLEAWPAEVGDRLVYLAGAVYRRDLPPGEAPMAGLPIGRQLQFLTNEVARVRQQSIA